MRRFGWLARWGGDPGPDQIFAFPVYFRGAMTLQQLRLTVGELAPALHRVLVPTADQRYT